MQLLKIWRNAAWTKANTFLYLPYVIIYDGKLVFKSRMKNILLLPSIFGAMSWRFSVSHLQVLKEKQRHQVAPFQTAAFFHLLVRLETWKLRPTYRSLVSLKMQDFYHIHNVSLSASSTDKASLQLWRCKMAANWEQALYSKGRNTKLRSLLCSYILY